MPSNSTNLTRLARALAAADGLAYQEALRQVRLAAGQGLLPTPLNTANRPAALAVVRAASSDSRDPQPWISTWSRTSLTKEQADEFFAGGGLDDRLITTSYDGVPGGEVHFYGTCRRAGATDAQAREVYAVEATHPFATADRYAMCRQGGATHEEALDVCTRDLPADSYAAARNVGATHQEATDPQIGMLGVEYANLRHNGRSHSELVELASKGTAVISEEECNYLCYVGATHHEALDCLYCAPDSIQVYAGARKAGVEHPDALELAVAQQRLARDSTALLEPYLDERSQGYSHQDGMITAINQLTYGTFLERRGGSTERPAASRSVSSLRIQRIATERLDVLTGQLGRPPTLDELRSELLAHYLAWAAGRLTVAEQGLSAEQRHEICLGKLRKQGLLSAIQELDAIYGWAVDPKGGLVNITSFVRQYVIDHGPTTSDELAALLSIDATALYDRLMREGRSARLRVIDNTWSLDTRPDRCLPPDQ